MSFDWANTQPSATSPAREGIAVDISSTDHTLTTPARALWVGGAGNVKVDLIGSTGITFYNVPAGSLLPFGVKKVYGSSSATLITAIW